MSPSTTDVTVIAPETLTFQPRADTTGLAHMAFCLPLDPSRSVHTGLAHWDQAQAPAKTLDYDEHLLVLEGTFGVTLADGRELTAHAGQVLFIPKGTTVHYHGSQAKIFFAISTPASAVPTKD